MRQTTINIWFVCKLCRGSFRQVDDFIEHKKENHFTEFQQISCIVFEERDYELQCPVIIKAENERTDENIEPIIKTEVNDDDPVIPFTLETNDESNLDLVEPKSERITFDSEINPDSRQNYFNLKQPQQNPYVLLKRLTSEEIQNASRASKSKDHSSLLRFEKTNLKSTEIQPTPTDINISTEHNRQFECKLCSKQLESDGHLKIHVGICSLYHKDRNRYCITCNRKLSDSYILKRHCLAYHGTEEERLSLYKFKCHFCPKRYQVKSDLCYHLECHQKKKNQVKTSQSSSKAKPFKCSQPNCGKEFEINSRLRLHTATHSGLRPFSCQFPNCNKKFTQRGNLKTHLRTHTGERPYKCTVDTCNETFSTTRVRSLHHLSAHRNSVLNIPNMKKQSHHCPPTRIAQRTQYTNQN